MISPLEKITKEQRQHVAYVFQFLRHFFLEVTREYFQAVGSLRLAVRWWPGWAAVLLFALLPVLASAQPARTFEVLGGSTHPDSLSDGTMLTLTEWRISESDTLQVWAERTTRRQPPSREKARAADRVVWCYPDQYPDDRHLFPDARVMLSFAGRQEGTDLIMFVTEDAYERHYAGDLGWQALALH
jgi:hypothetical protein